MRYVRSRRWLQAAVPGLVLLQLGGCLGPNPGFFISTSAANAAISTLVKALMSNVLGLGGD